MIGRWPAYALATVALVAAAAPAAAQTTSPGTARGKILRPITLSVLQDLNAGTVLPSTTRTSTVRVNLNDTRTFAGGALGYGTGHGSARISGTGTRNQVVLITRPTTVWLTGPGPQIRARSWTMGTFSGLTTVATNQYRISSATGAFSFRLGATLDLATNQAAGDYQGSFVITVNYQ